MNLNGAVNIFLLVICIAAIGYAVYVKIKSNTYTRERYTFAALSSIVSLTTLGVHSISTAPSWFVLRSIWSENTTSTTPHWSEHVLLAALIIFAMYFINQSVHFWDGLISVDQKRRKDLHDERPWAVDGLEELLRLLRQGPPHTVYRRIDFTRSFSPIQVPKDALAWHENAKDLVELRWEKLYFRR